MCGPWEETFAAAKLPSKPDQDDDAEVLILSHTSKLFLRKVPNSLSQLHIVLNLGNFSVAKEEWWNNS